MYKYLLLLLIVLFTFSTSFSDTQTINTLPSANNTFITDNANFLENEEPERDQDRGVVVKSGGIGATDASLTHTISQCIAYPNQYYVLQASVSRTYTASTDTFVFVRDDDDRVITIASAVITYNDYFVFAEMANSTDTPDAPTGTILLFEAVTDGTAITTVTDYRVLGTIILPFYNTYQVDYIQVDQGADTTNSLLNILTTYGTTKKYTVEFSHKGTKTNTDYIISTSLDASAYTNVTYKFQPGARVSPDTSKTLTFYVPENIIAGERQNIKTGSGTIAFARPGVLHPGWWPDGAPDASTDNTAAIQAAINAAEVVSDVDGDNLPLYGGVTVQLLPGVYITSSPLEIEDSFISFKGAGPAKTVIRSTATGAIVYVKGPVGFIQGTTVSNMSIEGDSTNTTYALQIENAQLQGMYFEKLVLMNFVTAGIYIDGAWNGLGIRDVNIDDRDDTVSGTQYGVYVKEACNNIQFKNFNIQGLSNGSDDTIGFFLGNSDNTEISGSTIKNVMNGVFISGGSLGTTLDGLYFEPNLFVTVAYPTDWYLIKAEGDSTVDPVRNTVVRNTKCGWGHTNGGAYTANIFDLDYVENFTIENCTLKADITAGTVNHFKMTSDAKFVKLYDTVSFKPEMGLVQEYREPNVSGDSTGLQVLRKSLFIPAVSWTPEATAAAAQIGASGSEINVIDFAADSSIAYAYATFGVPMDWSGDESFYATVMYSNLTTDTDAFKIGVGFSNIVFGTTLATVIPSISYKTTILETGVENQIDRWTHADWTGTVPRQGLIKAVIARDDVAAGDASNATFSFYGMQLWTSKKMHVTDETEVDW